MWPLLGHVVALQRRPLALLDSLPAHGDLVEEMVTLTTTIALRPVLLPARPPPKPNACAAPSTPSSAASTPGRSCPGQAREQLKDATAAGIVASLDTLLPDVDRAVLTGEFGKDLVAGFREALRTGVEGWLEDDIAFTSP